MAKMQVSQEDLLIEQLKGADNGITIITLNRLQNKNALSRKFAKALNDAVSSVGNSEARVLIIKSGIPGFFCPGADLKERTGMTVKEIAPFLNSVSTLVAKIHYLPIPVIAAVEGVALGGGMEIALAADIRTAATTAKMGLVEVRVGVMPGAGGTQTLPRLISPAVAKELMYTARVLSGSEAKSLGIVNHTVEQNADGDAAYVKALEIAREILKNAPVSVKLVKFAITRGCEVDLNNGLEIEQACCAQILHTKDRLEGLKAFQEKRKPKFVGE